MSDPVKILFVCLGNICRSPTAQGVFRRKAEQAGLSDAIATDSAGTAHWHVGKSPDSRSSQVAASRGVDISDLRARQVSPEDFHAFDYVLAMDHSNLSDLQAMAPADCKASVGLFLSYRSGGETDEVPDPYYGGASGFETVLDLIEDASDGLLADVRRTHSL